MPTAPTPVNPNSNPWNQTIAQDSNAGAKVLQSGQQTQSLAQGQMAQYGGDASAYPAMTNSYGLGSTPSAPIPGSASNPAFGGQPITVTMPDTASRGFNPWSLTGESNARGK